MLPPSAPLLAFNADQLPGLRRYLGLTQPDLADLLGLTRDYLAHIELGRRLLPLPARRVAAALLEALPAATRDAFIPPLTGASPAALPPPAELVPPPSAPDASLLAARRHRATQALRRAEAALAAAAAQVAAGTARLALLASPQAPDLGAALARFEATARLWTNGHAQARLRLLAATHAGLLAELAVLSA